MNNTNTHTRPELGSRVRYFDISNQNRYGTITRIRTTEERKSYTTSGIELPDLPRYEILWDDGLTGGADDRDLNSRNYTLNPHEA